MQRQTARFNVYRRRGAGLALLLSAAVMLLACGSLGSVTSAVSSAATGAAAVGSSQPAAGGTPRSAAGALSTAQCQKIGDAFIDFEGEYPFLAIASDSAYAANTPDSPTYINIPKLHNDLDVLSTLPGGTVGALGAALNQFRQLVDLVDSNFKAGGKPFSDGSNNGQKVMDEYLKLAVPYTIVAEGFGNSCSNYSVSTPVPDAASFQIGQTASVGDLRVTLDKVMQPPSDVGLPQAGNRFLVVHVTIKNVGAVPQTVTALSETNLKDSTGTSYGFDPFANSLAAVSGDNALDAQIPAGGTHAGLVGYQLPANAGDLLWIFHDYGQGRAIFAIKVSDIDLSGASSAPTEDALRSSAGATMTEFMNLVATSDAMALTATAGPPDAAAPTDTPAP